MGAYYPDEGNQNTEFSHNVATALNDGRPARPNGNAWWLFLWKNTIRNCPIFSNFAENGTGCWNAVRRLFNQHTNIARVRFLLNTVHD
jgi:hypothetical protein